MARHLLVAGLVVAWVVLLLLRPSFSIAEDFHPVIHASQWLLRGGDPYADAAVDDLKQQWPSPHAATGFAYPLPLALLLAPLAVLPLPLAVSIWLALGFVGTYAAITLRPDWRALLPLPLLWMPFWDGFFARQVTLVWFALVVAMLLALRHRQAWLVGLAIVLLPIKPQVGLLFAGYGALRAWQQQRAALAWALGFGLLFWGGSLLVDPTWPQAWLAALERYGTVNSPPSIYILLLPLLFVTWHLPWPARLAALQVGLFPLNGVYTLLPLLLIWVCIGGRRALIGASLSWLYAPFIASTSAPLVMLCMLVPLLVCGYLDRRDRAAGNNTKRLRHTNTA